MTRAAASLAFDAPRAPSKALWLSAAGVAIFLHAAAIAVLLTTFVPDGSDDDIGTPAIEAALDMTAPKAEASDLPPGPVADASDAAPDVMEKTKKAERTDLPKEQPVERENPDRAVAPDAVKKLDPDKPDTAAMEANPSAASEASDAAAPPVTEAAREAPRAASPVLGTGANARREKAAWQKQLVAHLNRHKRYPASETGRNAEIVVNFTIDRIGHVVSASVAKGSGSRVFDEAALSMVRRSDPVPPPPPLIADEGLSFSVPVVFRSGVR